MFKLVVATLVAFYCVMIIFGDEARRPAEVARAEPLGLELVTAATLPTPETAEPVLVTAVSDRDAIEIAMAAGRELREERQQTQQNTKFSEVIAAAKAAEQAKRFWYVTGSKVNLRGGPGTTNAVVGQVTFGTEAFVIADRGGWYQIRLADGSVSGWIFGKFLSEEMPS